MAEKPLFISDSCIGGLSVLRSLWSSGKKHDVVFMADYASNPLGTKSEFQIADVAENWLRVAAAYADTVVIGCNTLSIRYEQMGRQKESASGLCQVVTMVDCFRAMVQKEAAQFAHKRILIIGTAFTASQLLYPDILTSNVPSIKVSTVAATALEGSIARMKKPTEITASLMTNELQIALQHTDIALLACTCFPMVLEELESLFPKVVFLDPGIYCPGLLHANDEKQKRELQLIITGSVVSPAVVQNFAANYLCVDSTPIVATP